MLPSIYGCSAQVSSFPDPEASSASWSSATSGTTSLWTSAGLNYNNPVFSYDSATTSNIIDTAFNIVIDFNGGSGYTAGNVIEQFDITITGSETPGFTGDITGRITTLNLADTTLVIPALSGGSATFDIMALILTQTLNTTAVVSWANPDRLGTFATTIDFACRDDLGNLNSFQTVIAQASIPQTGPTVIQPTLTATLSSVQAGVNVVGSGSAKFNSNIPMQYSGGGGPAAITDYELNLALAFDNNLFQATKYNAAPNTLENLQLNVAPIGGPNFVWIVDGYVGYADFPIYEVAQFSIANPPTTTSYDIRPILLSLGLIDNGLGMWRFDIPLLPNTFTFQIEASAVEDIYGRSFPIDITIPASDLIAGP